jgi:hypothetical protein
VNEGNKNYFRFKKVSTLAQTVNTQSHNIDMSANECKIHHMPRENDRRESILTWKGRELENLGNVSTEMFAINNNDDAAEFAARFREGYGDTWANIIIFKVCSWCKTGSEMIQMLTRFTQRDCTKDIFIVEVPKCIIKVHITDNGFQGAPSLNVLDPKEISIELPHLDPRAGSYFVIDGPARMLTHDEWACLVNDKPLLE